MLLGPLFLKFNVSTTTERSVTV